MKNLDVSVLNTKLTVATVKWWNDAKGFGFVQCPEVPGDIFAHYSAVIMPNGGYQTLTEGASVLCEIVTGPKGPQAFNIQPMAKE